MRVISRTTNGKKERIAFAATENAKVWTSVRNKYFSVERSRDWEARAGRRREECWRMSLARGGAGMGGCAMNQFMVAEGGRGGGAQVLEERLPSYFFIFVKVIENSGMAAEFVRNSPLIFLANRFNSPYYRVLITGIGPVVRPVSG